MSETYLFQLFTSKSRLRHLNIFIYALFPVFVFSEVKDLIQKCLSVQPGDRPTLEAIVAHPWMQTASTELQICQVAADRRSLDEASTSSRESI